MWSIICYSTLGFVVGVFYSLLFINFDRSWKKISSFLFSVGGSGGILFWLNDYFKVYEQVDRYKVTTAFVGFVFIGFSLLMFIMCKLIKDKDDDDVLRIRDILLGQKSYIDKYYAMRGKEIDERNLNIPMLEKRGEELNRREEQLLKREEVLMKREDLLEEEKSKLRELGTKKLKINIPIDNQVLLSEKFLKLMPSYIDSFSTFIHQINIIKKSSFSSLRIYLFAFSVCMSKIVFGGNDDVRIHFRYYNEEEKNYEELVSIRGVKSTGKKLTPIPYENSMIKKSFETGRCLLKSVNPEYEFKKQNFTKWKDYMTYAFNNYVKNERPYLTFGISVKNEEKYKEIFYFLNFIEIESYLDEFMYSINEYVDIEKIINKEGSFYE